MVSLKAVYIWEGLHQPNGRRMEEPGKKRLMQESHKKSCKLI